MKRKTTWLGVALVLAVACGCTFISPDMRLTPCRNEPDWVAKGGGVFGGPGNTAVYAVGSALPAEGEEANLKAKALENAREELEALAIDWTRASNEHLAKELADSFKRGQQGAAKFFREATKDLPGIVVDDLTPISTWQCEVTGETFRLVGVPEDRVATLYTREVQNYLKENSEPLKVAPEAFRKRYAEKAVIR